MDGLSAIPPIADPYYTKDLRPTLHMTAGDADGALPLDGFFGMHPALQPLMPSWTAGHLAVIHQVGSPVSTRSHFDAQDMMESGTPGIKVTEDGFLSRALTSLPTPSSERGRILRAVALQPNLPRILWGGGGAFALNSIKEFSGAGALEHSGTEQGFESMYEGAMDRVLRGAGQQTFDAMKAIKELPPTSANVSYPKAPIGKHLSEIAQMIRGNVGLRVAVTDVGGWDTHQRQGGAKGQLANQLRPLAESIAAFTQDLGPALMEKVCLVTMTEFGRTVHENGDGGTDHGHGSVMFVLGGKIRGKKVITDWKNLAKQNLFEGRDLPITTDFRDVWATILEKHLNIKNTAKVFPNYTVQKKLSLFV
jgi:uncharacterized protein (DUF1501 family)